MFYGIEWYNLPISRFVVERRKIEMSIKTMKPVKYRRFSLLCLFASIPLGFIGPLFNSMLISISAISLFLVFFVISLIFWRCPNCKERLPMRFKLNKEIDGNYNCPYCNCKLE